MIQSLRKEKGGYALLYVMVVVMVLCAISMMICTVALRSLQSQEASVRRMQDLYAAEGEIEKIKASVEQNISIDLDQSDNEDIARKKFVQYVCNHDNYKKYASICVEDEKKIVLTVQENSVQITAVLDSVDLSITSHKVVDAEGNAILDSENNEQFTYTLDKVTTKFDSYTIENTGGGS